MAKELKLSVRQFGKKCICVYKKRPFKEVLNELMSYNGRENIKYKLVEPSKKLNPNDLKHHDEKIKSLEHLFDYQKEDFSRCQEGIHVNKNKRSHSDIRKQSCKKKKSFGEFRKSNPHSGQYPNSNQEQQCTTSKDSSNCKTTVQKLSLSNLPNESANIKTHYQNLQSEKGKYMHDQEEVVQFEDSGISCMQKANLTQQSFSYQQNKRTNFNQPSCSLSFDTSFERKYLKKESYLKDQTAVWDTKRRECEEFVQPSYNVFDQFQYEKDLKKGEDFNNGEFNTATYYSRDCISQNMLISSTQRLISSKEDSDSGSYSRYAYPDDFNNRLSYREKVKQSETERSEPLWSRRGDVLLYDSKHYNVRSGASHLYSRRTD